MATHKSAEKRIRRNERRRLINRSRLSRVRTVVKQVETAIAGGDKVVAQAALQRAEPELMRGANKGVVHKNMVARKISRLSARIKVM
jgi:small subunit ribosomal protein S20